MARRLAEPQFVERRPTRTERIIEARRRGEEESKIQAIEQVREQIKDLPYEQYRQRYADMPNWMRPYFKAPSEIEATPEYAAYEKRKEEYRLVQLEAEEWRIARRYASMGRPPSKRMSVGVWEKYHKIAGMRFGARAKWLAPEGYKPVFSAGRIVGYEDVKAQKSIPVSEFASYVAEKQALTEAPEPMTYEQWKEAYPSVVTPAKVGWEGYKEYVKGRPIAKTISYGLEKLKGFGTQVALGKYGEHKWAFPEPTGFPYAPEPSGELLKLGAEFALIRTGAYAPIMVATGVETYVTKAGREELEYLKEKVETEYKIPDPLSYAVYGYPAAMVGIGLLGVKSQIKGVQKWLEIKRVAKAPTYVTGYRLETTKGGYDILYGIKKVKGIKYYTTIKQPFYKVSEGKIFTLEAGKGVTYRYKYPRLTGVSYDITGRGRIITGTGKLVKISKTGDIIKYPLKDVQLGAGWVKLTGKHKIDIKFKAGYELPTTRWQLIGREKIAPYTDITRTKWLGVGQGDRLIKTASGNVDKILYNVVKDQFRLMGKPEYFGVIRRIDVGKYGIDTGLGKTILRTKLIGKTTPIYAEKVIDQSIKNIIDATTKTSQITKSAAAGVGAVSSRAIQSINKAVQTSGQMFEVVTKEREAQKIRFDVGQRSMLNTLQKQQNRLRLKSEQRLKQQQLSMQKQQVAQMLGQKQLQKQMQKQVTTTITRIVTPKIRIPFIPIPLIPFILPKKKRKKKKLLKKKFGVEYTYSPTYIEKILGIAPLKLTEKQALKLVKKEFKGFELFPPVKIIKEKKLKRKKRK